MVHDSARGVARVASDEAWTLGEGPAWDAARERVLWVDIEAGLVLEGRLDGERVVDVDRRRADRTVGAVVPGPAGRRLVAGRHGLVLLDADGSLQRGPAILGPGSSSRLNDGACDPAGRFLVGSLDLDGREGGEILVRVGHDGTPTPLDADLTLSNGLGWSPDGSVLYSIDSVPGVVHGRAYDVETGIVGPRRDLFRVEDGIPDGMCVDADGCLWIAIWGAGEVRRYAPDGRLAGALRVPAPHPTSAAFVGRELDLLLITTAARDLTPEQRRTWPDAGRLFVARPSVPGTPVAPWAGWTPAGGGA